MALKDVAEIELDKKDMFQHFIYLRNKDSSLAAKIKCLPKNSDSMFQEILEKWTKEREYNGTKE